MREFAKINRYYMSMQELAKITEEVYGIAYDVQLGEKPQGTYEIVTTGIIDSIQGYWTGTGKGHGYHDKYIEGAKWIAFGMEGVEEGEGYKKYEGLDEEANVRMALDKWIGQIDNLPKYDRPFDTVGDNGEYTYYQPDLDVVMTDLVKRGEIPAGEYQIDIDW